MKTLTTEVTRIMTFHTTGINICRCSVIVVNMTWRLCRYWYIISGIDSRRSKFEIVESQMFPIDLGAKRTTLVHHYMMLHIQREDVFTRNTLQRHPPRHRRFQFNATLTNISVSDYSYSQYLKGLHTW